MYNITNRQEAFDHVLAHLRKQGGRAVDARGECVYIAADGKKCAIGSMITDENYSSDLENTSPYYIKTEKALARSGVKISSDKEFLAGLQRVLHDSLSDKEFLIQLETAALMFAGDWKLKYEPSTTSR